MSTKVYVVKTVKVIEVGQYTRNFPEITLGVFADKLEAEKVAFDSLTLPDGYLSKWFGYNEDTDTYKNPIKREETNTTVEFGIYRQGIDWHDQGGWSYAAKVEESILK